MNPFVIIGIYLLVGIIVLSIFDLTTKRIRRKFVNASYDAQDKLTEAGQLVGTKTSRAIMAGYILVFWPAVIVGAISTLFKGKK